MLHLFPEGNRTLHPMASWLPNCGSQTCCVVVARNY